MKKVLIVVGIVLLILGVCIGSVVFIVGKLTVDGTKALQQSQRETLRLNDLREVAMSLEEYYTMYRAYPRLSNASGLKVLNQVTDKRDLKLESQTISFLDPVTGLSTKIKTIVSSPGVEIYTGSGVNQTITCFTGNKASESSLGSSSDVWQIYYLALGDNPQEYKLEACTENGLSKNIGTLK